MEGILPPEGLRRGADESRPGAATPIERRRWSFELRIRPHTDSTFQVHLLSSPAGDAVGDLELSQPADGAGKLSGALTDSALALSRNVRPQAVDGDRDERPPSLETVGEALFEALFPHPVRRRWRECVQKTTERTGHDLRLILKSDPTCRETADLHRLPWELLRDPETGAFLTLSKRSTVVRQLALDDAAILEAPKPAETLRILAVLSCPPGLDSLNLSEERQRIEEAVERRPEIGVTFLESPTFGELTAALREEAFHVLHFMGHGLFDPGSDRGFLFFTSPDGEPAPVPADRLAQVVGDDDSLRLVFLNACETGRTSERNDEPFAAVAHALIRSGVPAVLAMQMPIPDRAAVELARVFYRHLALGEAVDEALAEARIAVYAADDAEGSGACGSWAVPTLFVRRPDLAIFTPFTPSQGASPSQSDGPRRRAIRRPASLALFVALAAALISLFFVPAPWAEVQLSVKTSRIGFTLTEPHSLVDNLPLEELAVFDLERVRHPDPETGGERSVQSNQVASEYLGFRVASEGRGSPLSLDDAVLPTGTRIDIESFPPGLRISLDFSDVSGAGAATEVTASTGDGATLVLLPGPSDSVALPAGRPLVLTPRAGRIDLDLVPATGATHLFHAPLPASDPRFFEVEVTEEPRTWHTVAKAVSTVESGQILLKPLGGTPQPVTVKKHEAITFGGLRGRITSLSLDDGDLAVAFQGRTDRVTRHMGDGQERNLMPTWSQTPWALRVGGALSVLALVAGLINNLGVLLGWSTPPPATAQQATFPGRLLTRRVGRPMNPTEKRS